MQPPNANLEIVCGGWGRFQTKKCIFEAYCQQYSTNKTCMCSQRYRLEKLINTQIGTIHYYVLKYIFSTNINKA